jgi:DNA (cytosine-5)-methyltransferase 1
VTFGSLFAGIGGMDLGLERAGMRCVWQVEIDPFCRRVLAKHWPDVRRHDDIRTFPPGDGADWRCDLIAGGFPCQDISFAGKGAGIEGERSGLWAEYARVIRALRPRFVLVENVAALLDRGMGRVLGDLAACGYDAEWDCLPAAAVGAPHRRERLFLVAYPHGERQKTVLSADPGDGGALEAERGQPAGGRGRSDLARRWDGAELLPNGRLHQPGVPLLVDGVPAFVGEVSAYGNAVVPEVAEWIGRRILAVEGV